MNMQEVESTDLFFDADNVVLLPQDAAKIAALPSSIPIPKAELEYRRLAIVRQTGLLGAGGGDVDFDRLVALTSRIFGMNYTFLSIIEADTQWIVASRAASGATGSMEIPRHQNCSHLLLPDSPDVYVVTGPSEYHFHNDQVRVANFYAGTALVVDNVRIGTLVVTDGEAREFKLVDKQNLLDLGRAASDLIRARRDNHVRLNTERSNLLLHMTGNLYHPLENIGRALISLQSAVTAADALLGQAIGPTLADLDGALKNLHIIMETALTFGKILNQQSRAREDVSCDLLQILRDIRTLSAVYANHGHIDWAVDALSFDPDAYSHSSFPDAIVFSLLSSLAELCPQWKSVHIGVSFSGEAQHSSASMFSKTVAPGTFRRNSMRSKLPGFATIRIRVTDSVTESAGQEADFNSSSLRRDFSSIDQVLTELEGSYREEADDSGRTFIFAVPCFLRPRVLHTAAHKTRVLIADSSYSFQSSMSQWFVSNDCEVIVASSGKGALEAMTGDAFDVVMLELLLPVMSGVEVLEAYERWRGLMGDGGDWDKTLVVGMGFSASTQDRGNAFEHGMHIFCAKPVEVEVLQGVLSAVRDNEGLSDALHAIVAAFPQLSAAAAS